MHDQPGSRAPETAVGPAPAGPVEQLPDVVPPAAAVTRTERVTGVLGAPTDTLPDGRPAYRLKAACDALGLTYSTLLGRLHDGRLDGASVTVPGRRNQRHLVAATALHAELARPATRSAPTGAGTAAGDDTMELLQRTMLHSELSRLRSELELLRSELRHAEERAAASTARADRLAELLAEQAHTHANLIARLAQH